MSVSARWMARIPEQAPAYVRAATLCGGLALIGVFGPDWVGGADVRGQHYYGHNWEDAAAFFLVQGIIALGLLAAAGRAAHRAWANLPAPASWWSSGSARLLSVVAMGIGVGCFLDNLASFSWGDPIAFAWLGFSVLTIAVAGTCERGLASVGLVALGVLIAGLTVFVHGYRGWSDSWRLKELIIFAVISLAFIPLLTLLVQGLLSLTQRGASAGMHGAARPAYEVASRDGGWLVRVETPGLADPTDARIAVDGRRLVVGFARPVPPPGQVLFQGRARGEARLVVLLPGPAREDGAATLEHGLLSVPLRGAPDAKLGA